MNDEPQDIIAGLRNALIFTLAFMGLVAGASLILRDGEDAEVIAKIESEVRERKSVRPELCISQFGPAERWIQPHVSPSSLTCASPAAAVPNHIMTRPAQ